MDRSWWRGLKECGPLEKEMANHLEVLGASISTVASKWPSQHICSATSLHLSLESLLVPLFLCPALRCCPKLARRALVWIALHRSDLCGLPSAPKFTLCAMRLLRTCLRARGPPSVPGARALLFRLPRPALCPAFMCMISCYRLHSLSRELFVLSAVPGGLVVWK